jgi:hypothetical protein
MHAAPHREEIWEIRAELPPGHLAVVTKLLPFPGKVQGYHCLWGSQEAEVWAMPPSYPRT